MRRRNQAVRRLTEYGTAPSRRWRWALVTLAVLALGGGFGGWYLAGRGAPARHPSSAATPVAPLRIVAVTPSPSLVTADPTVSIRFSAPLRAVTAASPTPTLQPPVSGTWRRSKPTTLTFAPSAPFIPSTTEVLTIPGGAQGIRGMTGGALAATATVSFKIATGSEARLEQLLALTGYLPLTFTPSGAAPSAARETLPETGSFSWRWGGLPDSLTSLWVQGEPSAITKGAVMALEDQNGLAVDAIAGARVWTVLLDDVAKGITDPAPYDYVAVSKVEPESLTLWVDGAPKFAGIPVNTGAPGADTTDGTYEVFEHVTSSEMKGTNPDGTTYDDPDVPWASYFNGGDALHGFVRATYGSPQSNGCVEMSVADAGATWPYTPIGTLVTIAGPTVG